MARESRGSDARTRILLAARRAFGANGHAGTSMRQIANGAGVTQGLVHHHFGTKEALYAAVKDEIVAEMVSAVGGVADLEPSVESIATAIRAYFDFWLDRPDAVRIRLWARMEGDWQSWLAAESDEAYLNLIDGAVRRGIVRDDVDPRMILSHGTSLVLGWFSDREAYCAAYGEDPSNRALDVIQREAIVHTLLHGNVHR